MSGLEKEKSLRWRNESNIFQWV